jgi:gamma-glutamyltranspeptidase / glutathione hydrolase
LWEAALLETFARVDDFLDPDYVHASIESAKLVQQDRARWIGDRAEATALARLLEPAYIAQQRAEIGPRALRLGADTPAPDYTVTLAVVDRDGNAVHLM